MDDENSNKLCVDFMDKKGASISRNIERKIENSFVREDLSVQVVLIYIKLII
jgi:mannose-1-phosphate guanylyltransferase/phosphomannomutase